MQFTYFNKIIETPFHSLFEEVTFELPKRLGEKSNAISCNVLENLKMIKIFTSNRHGLTSYFIHLIERE